MVFMARNLSTGFGRNLTAGERLAKRREQRPPNHEPARKQKVKKIFDGFWGKRRGWGVFSFQFSVEMGRAKNAKEAKAKRKAEGGKQKPFLTTKHTKYTQKTEIGFHNKGTKGTKPAAKQKAERDWSMAWGARAQKPVHRTLVLLMNPRGVKQNCQATDCSLFPCF